MIGVLSGHIPQQVGIERILLRAFAQVGAGVDRRQPHLAHMPRHGFVIDPHAIAPQVGRDAAHTIVWASSVDGINLVFERHLLRRWPYGRVVQAGTIQAEQGGLGGEWQVAGGPFQQRQPISSRQRDGQLFFSHAKCVDSLPISA